MLRKQLADKDAKLAEMTLQLGACTYNLMHARASRRAFDWVQFFKMLILASLLHWTLPFSPTFSAFWTSFIFSYHFIFSYYFSGGGLFRGLLFFISVPFSPSFLIRCLLASFGNPLVRHIPM